jgi:hypothetical protein
MPTSPFGYLHANKLFPPSILVDEKGTNGEHKGDPLSIV